MHRFLRLSSRSLSATSSAAKTRVAVTGASGYLGSYVVAELLARGYGVHGCVRGCTENPEKAAHLHALPGAERLTLFDGTDLSIDGSFDDAFADADAVIHTAAAVAITGADPSSIIGASVEGSQNVLRSVDLAPGVTRFVQTSSVAAVQTYDKPPTHVFSESDWNDWSTVENGDAYGVAKTQAERLVAAHFADDAKRSCVAINPGVVIGPVMTKAHTKASGIYLREVIFSNKVQTFPSSYVDVRDVAAAHVNALERLPELDGERFVVTGDAPCAPDGALKLAEIATRLFPENRFDPKPQVSPTLMGLLRSLSCVPLVGRMVMSEFERNAVVMPIAFDNTAAREKLGLAFRSLDETVKDGIDSFVERGFARPKPR
jgi:dihydroflavonol-4-reductase